MNIMHIYSYNFKFKIDAELLINHFNLYIPQLFSLLVPLNGYCHTAVVVYESVLYTLLKC